MTEADLKERLDKAQTLLDSITAAKERSDAFLADAAEAGRKAAALVREAAEFVTLRKGDLDTIVGVANERLQDAQRSRDAVEAALQQVTAIQGVAQTAASHTDEVRTQAGSVLDAARASAATAEEARKRAENAADAAAAKSEHIEGGRVHAEEVRARLEGIAGETRASAERAEAQHQASLKSTEAASAALAAVQATRAAVEVHAQSVASLHSQAENHTKETQGLASTAADVKASIETSRTELESLQETARERLQVIEELLLGATNAGLAHAFDKRSKEFKGPEKFWQRLFFLALAGLFALAVAEALPMGGRKGIPAYDDLLRMLVHRIPLLLPMIWLAIHAARQASFAKRMEEEYAFKATISTSFEGYRRQMADLEGDLSEASPLARLCIETLRVIARPPGNVYEKSRMDPTPGTAAAEFVAPAVEAVSKATRGKAG